ncbi:cell wall metabolism sensor histidine kinase WalK [Piscibacillus halophilus]|uniref:histidine kinase n=1 Tax=Piscibacillus halophilus TaxID=571933 RepID=A0A1H9CYL2_9BACI|nr:cell wall metabolism sensor histidine kinase WalK [Piscibacillus halophilus]SEQ06274.1 PAS/PAC sensor signal transduction histidine kinase [Piscibacillus halophilus]
MRAFWGFFKSIQLKMITVYILLILITIQVIGTYFAQQLEAELKENFTESINDRVELLTYNLSQAFMMDSERPEEAPSLESDVQTIINDFTSDEINVIEVIDTNNHVLGTTNPLERGNVGKKTTETRIQQALSGNTEEKIMYNRENGHRTLVVSSPIFKSENSDEIVGAIRLEASLESVYGQMNEIIRIFANGTVLSITVSALLGILVARTITKPITEMRKQAKVMGQGDYSQKVNVYGTDEIGQLAETFNELNDKIKIAQASTEGERRKLSLVLTNMTDGVIATDQNGQVILMNPPAERLLKMNQRTAEGASLVELIDIDDDVSDINDLKDMRSTILDLSEGDQLLLVRANFSEVQDENNEMSGIITVLSDVTEQEKIERERRDFVANVSHELRTPLTTMRSYLEALTEGNTWKDENIAPKFLSVTQNETERMIRLVNDLLQLSKMDNKDYQLHKERVNYTDFIHHVVDRFELNLKEDITITRDIPNRNYYVWIDKDKIIQVLDNIISNAIKYSPEGGEIIVQVVEEKHQLLTKISDEGVGIPEKNLDKIFDRFYRVDKARSRQLGGTGLGLAIAKELIEAHDGEVWANSKEHEGTTITFRLPLMQKKRGHRK